MMSLLYHLLTFQATFMNYISLHACMHRWKLHVTPISLLYTHQVYLHVYESTIGIGLVQTTFFYY